MRYLIILACLMPAFLAAQAHRDTILAWQQELNRSYADSSESPLKEKDRQSFTGLAFFPIDSNFRVEAVLERSPKSKPFEMATTTGRQAIYQKYATADFVLNGDSVSLAVYQSHRLMNKPGYEDYLFLPFTDQTNGVESYGGGRYISLSIPENDTLIIDFNKAYNPYCAYNERYSCPIPPQENKLEIAIEAGVLKPEK